MEWMVKCRSKTGTGGLRERTLPAHTHYLDNFAAESWYSGPVFSDDNTTALGSFRLIDLPQRTDAERYIRDDPYTRAEIFAAIDIIRWRPLFALRQREAVRRDGTQQWLAISKLREPGSTSAIAAELTTFAERHRSLLLACGPLLDDSGDTAHASLALFDIDNRAAVDQALSDAPLAQQYDATTIERWRFGHV